MVKKEINSELSDIAKLYLVLCIVVYIDEFTIYVFCNSAIYTRAKILIMKSYNMPCISVVVIALRNTSARQTVAPLKYNFGEQSCWPTWFHIKFWPSGRTRVFA